MSQKSVDLENAIELLRGEIPSDEVRGRAFAMLRQKRRSRLGLRLCLLTLSGLGIAFVIWPRETSGAAWARVIAATSSARIVHRTSTDAKEDVTMDEWMDGVKSAYWTKQKGKIIEEARYDGKRMFLFYSYGSNRPTQTLPNARRTAVVFTPDNKFDSLVYPDTIEKLLKERPTRIAAHESVKTADGDREKYLIDIEYGPKGAPYHETSRVTVFTEPETGRIRKTLSKTTVSVTSYPTSILETVFEPRPQIVTNVEFHDLDREREQIDQIVHRGIASKDGVTVRLVALDRDGYLYALWTGSVVDSKASHPFRVIGATAGRTFAPDSLTTNWDKVKKPVASPLGKERIYGMGRELLSRVGGTVTIEVYRNGHYVRLANLPVMRISSLQEYADRIGMRNRPSKSR